MKSDLEEQPSIDAAREGFLKYDFVCFLNGKEHVFASKATAIVCELKRAGVGQPVGAQPAVMPALKA